MKLFEISLAKMKVLSGLFVILLYSSLGVNGQVDQIKETVDLCCNTGLGFANDHPDGDASGCSSSDPPEDIAQDLALFCNMAMDKCCKGAYKETTDCEEGKKLAASQDCTKPKTDIGKNCCDECALGKIVGSSEGKKSCRKESYDDDESSSISMRRKVFEDCCMEAASDKDETDEDLPESATTGNKVTDLFGDPELPEESTQDEEQRSTTALTTPSSATSATDDLFSSKDEKTSVCDLYAPDELCAHHCIAIPGSYKCSCNPGFQLMADKKSCKKLETNRCKHKNPCQQKCNDLGEETVTCSCKRGYELLEDNTSCIDVDECELEIAKCREGTICQNTEGSYKCIQDKNYQKKEAPSDEEPDYSIPAERGGCPIGFKRNRINNVCDDINECILSRPACPKGMVCVNNIGSFACSNPGGVAPGPPILLPSSRSEKDRCPPGFRWGGEQECVDIDECEENKDDCNRQSQYCLNTHGKFTCRDKASKGACPPGFKLDKSTGICVDIDECLESSDICSPNSVCVNEPGGYNCKLKPVKVVPRGGYPSKQSCPVGFFMSQKTGVCEDIDECIERTHNCDRYQDCLNTFGSHECRCKIGFQLDPTTKGCVDINECQHSELHTCAYLSQRCDNTIGSYHCIRYTSCGTGYTLNSDTDVCEDDDECALKLDNCSSPDYDCLNLPGTFRCVPKRNAAPSAKQYNSDEYYDESVELEENVTESTPTSPATPNRASNPTSAPELSKPAFNGSRPRFPTSSHPEDAVDFEGAPDENGNVVINAKDLPVDTWTNLVPKDKKPDALEDKHCIFGYVKNEYGDCVDLNECITGENTCLSPSEICQNTEGGYICRCGLGYLKDELTGLCRELTTEAPTTEPLTSTTEPPTSTTEPSTTTSTTTTTTTPTPPPIYNRYPYNYNPPPTPRPYRPRIVCDAGYQPDYTTRLCVDADECTNGVATCAAVEVCVNTPGAYRCECPPSWVVDPVRQRCVPPRSSRPNTFPSGYSNQEEQVSSSSKSENGYPSKTFTIGSRYGSPSSSQNTKPIRQKVGNYGEVLTNCPWGYELSDDERCIDIDECASGTHSCGAGQLCSNAAGGYVCRCPTGHRLLKEQNRCEDINECQLAFGQACTTHSDCINTEGSYECRCHKGFRQAPANDKVCVDVDECSASGGDTLCDHTCVNLWGGHRCACHRGYKLAADNRTCVDIDECKQHGRLCVGNCLNTPGSYRCHCPAGYYLANDARTCVDIDECETGEASCASGAGDVVCQNTRGSYKCNKIVCPPGYERELNSRHRCTRIQGLCGVNDMACLRKPGTYSYNFISFVSRLYIPPSPAKVDLFTMKGPHWEGIILNFQFRFINVIAPSSVLEPADRSCFLLTPSANQAMVSLVKSLQGPQEIELELSMEQYNYGSFQGTAVAKIFILVSEYEY